MTRPRVAPLVRLVAVVAAATTVAGCSGGGGSSGTTTPHGGGGTTATIRTGPPATNVAVYGQGESGRYVYDQQVTVRVGAAVHLYLESTYWTIASVSDPSVVAQLGTPRTVDQIVTGGSSTRCGHTVPGSGCGTLQAVFVAKGSGTAAVTATRNSCGEAEACPTADRRFTLTVHVSS